MPPSPITIPASYQTQDSLAAEAGAFASAHNLRTMLRNVNYLNARMLHPFATAVWTADAPVSVDPLYWTEAGSALVGRVPAGFRRWRLRVIASIEAGETARFQLRGYGHAGTVDQSDNSSYSVVGSGAYESYGTAWTFNCSPSMPRSEACGSRRIRLSSFLTTKRR